MWSYKEQGAFKSPATKSRGGGSDWAASRVVVAMHLWSKSRLSGFAGVLLCVTSAICLIIWGSEYKLSLYDPPQAASHQLPQAKLLSKNEQASTTESSPLFRARTFTKVIHFVPAAISFLLLVAFSTLTLPVSGQWEQRSDRLWQLRRRALLNILFVRPPPVLV